MSALLKKGVAFRWDDKAIKSFEDIKDAISQAPVLVNPDYSRDFIIFSFASQDTIAGVLLQKDVDDYEHVMIPSQIFRLESLTTTDLLMCRCY
jgi:hypothetical protein